MNCPRCGHELNYIKDHMVCSNQFCDYVKFSPWSFESCRSGGCEE